MTYIAQKDSTQLITADKKKGFKGYDLLHLKVILNENISGLQMAEKNN